MESADTVRGKAIHKRVDAGDGGLPKTGRKPEAGHPSGPKAGREEAESASTASEEREVEPETIHSRSVQMGSDRLDVVAKMDLVEARTVPTEPTPGATGDLLVALEICPVDYKAGAPREGEEANELWDTDKLQLGLQALIFRDNGYSCHEGIVYYRATKQRVRLAITAELEEWVLQNVAEARRVVQGPIPGPLVDSPKCVRCSLAPVCLPDETRLLAAGTGDNAQLAFNFHFAHRNRRPPTDPLNVMLSLAYSMLSKDCTLAALAVGFDPYLGFFHQPRFGRPALALDLMEEFRPLVAESTVLSCINNRVITDKDVVRAGQAVNLSAPGCRHSSRDVSSEAICSRQAVATRLLRPWPAASSKETPSALT